MSLRYNEVFCLSGMSSFEKKTLTFSPHSSFLEMIALLIEVVTGQPNYPGEEMLTQCLTSATYDIIYIYLLFTQLRESKNVSEGVT